MNSIMSKVFYCVCTIVVIACLYATSPSYVTAQHTNVRAQNLTILVSLFGIENTGNLFVYTNIGNFTKGGLYNATLIDEKNSEDNSTDGIGETSIAFRNLTVYPGETFRVCSLVLNEERLFCQTGFISPKIKPEFISIGLRP